MDPVFAEAGRTEFVTDGGIRVTRTARPFDPAEMSAIASAIDHRRGGVLSSGMEYPGRYSRWHMAYVDPGIEIIARGPLITARALNDRGLILLPVLAAAFGRAGTPPRPGHGAAAGGGAEVTVRIPQPSGLLPEEERTRRPTVFSALREVAAAFRSADSSLGLYGAFGYDLAFQFEPVRLRHERPGDQRDLVLHLPDQLYMVDRKRETALCYSYDFEVGTAQPGTIRSAGPGIGRTHGLPRAASAGGAGPRKLRAAGR